MANCATCKWWKLLEDPNKTEKQLGLKESEILVHCDECVAKFANTWRGVCRDCAWKDRNLPYWQRTRHCDVCAKAFAKSSKMDCGACPWNDPKSHQPSDASLAHCKACIAAANGSKCSMGCDECPAKRLPTVKRQPICLKCSLRFVDNPMVTAGTNELSNAGHTFISYDNHNSAMTDDRDVVMQVAADYSASRKASSEHASASLTRLPGESEEDFAKRIFEMMMEFLRRLADLPDIQALLFLSKIRGQKPTDFAFAHGISDSTVHQIYEKLVMASPIFREFMKSVGITGIDKIVEKRSVAADGSGAKRRKAASRTKHVNMSQMEFDFINEAK